MNDEPENREDTSSPSASQEPASSEVLVQSTTFKVRDPSERPSRKEKSAIQKFLPPVLGGLAALPLATAILWYGFGKDIGGIGPAVAQYIPWIVPQKLRGSGFRSDGTFGSIDSAYDVGPVPTISSRQLPSDGFKSNLPSLGADSNKSSLDPTNVRDGSVEKTDSDVSQAVEIAELSESIQDLMAIKEKWSSIPRERDAQLKAVSDFYGYLCEIAKWSDSQDDDVTQYWHQQRDSIANMILEDPKFSALVKRCAAGEIAGAVSLDTNSHIVTVIPSGFEFTDNAKAGSVPQLTLESMIAGSRMSIEFPSANEQLISKAKGLETDSPFLLFLRIEKRADVLTLTAIDCMTSN
ncbi:MAG: hypothetical protein ACK5YR_02065 [Pirellula sp.]